MNTAMLGAQSRPSAASTSQGGPRALPLIRFPLQAKQWRAQHQGPRQSSLRMAAVPSDVFVVDFDGVICNTEPEVRTGNTFWLCYT